MDKSKKSSLKIIIFLLICNTSAFSMNQENKVIYAQKFIKNFPSDAKTDHSQWSTIINEQFNNGDCLKFRFSGHCHSYYYKDQHINFPEIILSKAELLKLNFNTINALQKIQKYHLTKNELLLLRELSDDLCDKLKPYSYIASDGGWNSPTNNRMAFHYKKKLTLTGLAKAALQSCKLLLPSLVPTLLYNHLYVESFENLWMQVQDPALLENNKQKAITNQLIDNLKANGIPGSTLLTKEIINPVPFEWIFPSDKYDEYFAKKMYSMLITEAIINIQLFKYFFFPSHKYFIPQRIEHQGSGHLNMFLFIWCNLFGIYAAPRIQHISKIVFSYGIPIGLAGIVVTVSLCGIIKEIISSCITKQKNIDFPKDKFKDKSFKEVIDYYLNESKYYVL